MLIKVNRVEMFHFMLVIKNRILCDVCDKRDVCEKKNGGQYHHPK